MKNSIKDAIFGWSVAVVAVLLVASGISAYFGYPFLRVLQIVGGVLGIIILAYVIKTLFVDRPDPQ